MACDAILTGEALRLARERGMDAVRFYPHRMLTPEAIEAYVRMMAVLQPSKDWKGPIARTIRGDKNGLLAYVKLRDHSAVKELHRPRQGSRGREVEDVVNTIESLADQALVRKVLNEGRLAKLHLDTVKHIIRRMPGITFTQETELSAEFFAKAFSGAIPVETVRNLETLYDRLTDNEALSEMGLVHRNGRVKMAFPPGNDLVLPEELATLATLIKRSPDRE